MIRRLARCVREYKWAAMLSPICMIGEVAMEVTIPLVMKDLYDYGVKLQAMDVIVNKSILLVLCAIASLMFGVASAIFASRAGTGFAKNLRHDMFYRVQKFSFSNIDKFSSASIVTRLTSDAANLQMTFQMLIRMAIRCPMMLILALISAYQISPELSRVYLMVLPVLMLALILLAPMVFKIFDRSFKMLDKMNNIVQENIHGMRVVKSFVREEKEVDKFTGISADLARNFSRAEKILALNGSFMMLSMVFVMMTMSRTPLRRCGELLAEEPDIVSPEKPVTEVADGSIDFENVSFRYSAAAQHRALKEVNIHIPSGATVGIIGSTGSSKSTLVQLIPRLYDVSEGTLKVGGVDVRDYDLEVLRDNVAMVLQKNVLFSGSIKENLRWGNPEATDEELIHACQLACAHDFITSFPDGYDTHIEQGGTNVSGGQKQRLCIARALLKKPKILILDDSTSAVDTATDAQIRKAFREEIPGTTKLIIAQRFGCVQEADMIIVMDNGQISAVGNHEQLMATSAIYQEVYYSQQKGGME